MKLEVGMYVRTKYNGILSLLNEDKEHYYFGKDENHIKQCCLKEDLERFIVIGTLPTHNIVDLVEVGDYVNGYKVLEICIGNFEVNNPFNVKALKLEYIKEDINPNIPFFKRYTFITNNEIKTVLTHEVFEREAYKV